MRQHVVREEPALEDELIQSSEGPQQRQAFRIELDPLQDQRVEGEQAL